MVRTAINLYSVRDLNEPMLDILDRVAAAGYDGVQFSGGFGDASPAEIADRLDDLGLEATPCHHGVEDLEADPAGVTATYDTIGVDGLVVPWLGAEHFEDREAAEATAGRLDDVAAELAEYGHDLHYHNHDHEFTDLGDTTGFAAFADASSVLLEPDVGWIATAGHDPVEVLRRYGDRVDLVHMKDMDADAGEFREIGEGTVDMQACADAARDIGAEWLIYEHDEPADPVASLEYGAEFLDAL
jgi:sugar phosphate isomerase/epimerase